MVQKQLSVIFLTIIVIVHGKSVQDKSELQVDVTRAIHCHESRQARDGDKVTVHYGGFLKDGKKFDSSFDRSQPFTFTLGVGQVIPGWDKGLMNVCKGEERHLVVPSHMAYGDKGAGNVIPPGATLLFDIVVVDVERVENEDDLKEKEEELRREEEEKRKLEEKRRREELKLREEEEKQRNEEITRREEEEKRRKEELERREEVEKNRLEELKRREKELERRKEEEKRVKEELERRKEEVERRKQVAQDNKRKEEQEAQKSKAQEGTRRKQEEEEYEYYDEDDYYYDYPSACGTGELEVKVTYSPSRCRRTASNGDKLTMHYVGKLESGTQFDSSVDRNKPFEFTLGVGQVIAGWDAGLEGMCVGETRTLVIPPDQAYGSDGVGSVIPACSTLVFDVELLDIQ